ncbi:hypothetical protein [Falsiroseomonas oryziterrae]|uniref:hypothetical protein n=1 Tax=Falsiroseomonas oryziterrae TaxID=2911368 RepID=UPI001F3659D2|nr:hypothetical protein [Roseomonas sp. NPKOSM-4]
MHADRPIRLAHNATVLRGLRLDSHSLDLPEGDGQLGDRASHRALDAILERWRQRMRRVGAPDPFGHDPADGVSREEMDRALADGTPEAAGVVHGVIEDYARTLAEVTRRFLTLPEWQRTERIAVGGGLRSARIGEVAIGRAAVLLRTAGSPVRITPIRHHPDEAGLIGAAMLLPEAALAGGDAVLVADLGGTSFRGGVVLPRLGVAPDLSAAGVWRSKSWRHAEEEVERDAAVARLCGLLMELVEEARAAGLHLAPVVGVGVPGVADAEGRILRGAENLPGDWHNEAFRFPAALSSGLRGFEVLMHNDAVVQALSEAPHMRQVPRWGVLTVGTGLGNARFTTLALAR